jgi:outer membrane protein
MRQTLTLSIMTLLIVAIVFPAIAKELKIGYIDSDRILSQYADYQDARRLLEQEENDYEQQARQMEMDIKNLETEIEDNSLMWSEEKRQEKMLEGQNLVMRYQNFLQEIWGDNGKLFQRNLELSKPIIDKVNAIIQKIGEEEEYDFIFDATTGNLVHAKPEYDLTDRIIDELEGQ